MVTKVWNSGLVLSVRSATTEFNDRYNGCSLTMCQLHMVMLLFSLDVVLNQTTQQNSCGMKLKRLSIYVFTFPFFNNPFIYMVFKFKCYFCYFKFFILVFMFVLIFLFLKFLLTPTF